MPEERELSDRSSLSHPTSGHTSSSPRSYGHTSGIMSATETYQDARRSDPPITRLPCEDSWCKSKWVHKLTQCRCGNLVCDDCLPKHEGHQNK